MSEAKPFEPKSSDAPEPADPAATRPAAERTAAERTAAEQPEAVQPQEFAAEQSEHSAAVEQPAAGSSTGAVEEADSSADEAVGVAVPAAPLPTPTRVGWRLRSFPRRVREWFTRSQSLREARAGLPADPAIFELRQRARSMLEAAERTLAPFEPFKHGPAHLGAAELFCQVIFWGLAAERGQALGSRAAQWDAAAPAFLESLGGSELRAAVLQSEADRGELPAEELAAQVERLARAARQLVAAQAQDTERLQRLRSQRLLRCGSVAMLVLVSGTWLGMRVSRGADLAALATWRASSVLDNCTPEQGTCRGKRFAPFFHTQTEASPWIEYDFGARRRVSRVKIRNRQDRFKERAVPLVVEVSDDRKSWSRVAHQNKVFDDLDLEFDTVSTRYVRLRVLTKSALHFESVEFYR